MSLRIATDVGGTFTDLVAFDESTGGLISSKVSTTPSAISEGVLESVEAAGVDLAEASFFVHGCTVVINAITERKGARTALVTTGGFRDILLIGRGNRPDMYNLRYHKPEPFVPRRLCFEVPERVDRAGEVLEPLDVDALDAVADRCAELEVEAIAVCFLHSYANPDHERAAKARLQRAAPGRRGHRLRGHDAPDARVRALEHHDPQRLRAARPRPLPHRGPGGRRGARALAHRLRDAVQRRHRVVRPRPAHPDQPRGVRPGRRHHGRGADRRAHRRAQRHLPRHRRHDRQVLADRGRQAADHDGVQARVVAAERGLSGQRARHRHRRDRSGRRLDRLGRRHRRACTSGRAARAPTRGPRATARAARRRRSPTRSWWRA